MSNLAIIERQPLPAEEVDLIKRTVASGASDAELKLFLFDCQRRGVHPLDKLLHFTKRGGKYTPVTSIDFMRSQAAMSGEMAGSDDPVFQNDEAGKPVAATVTVYRITQGQRFSYAATARWSEYCPDNAPMWKRMPHTMLAKCAEALALRKAFPQQLAGLYTADEMSQAGNVEPAREPVATLVEVEPEGFEDWWIDMGVVASEGVEALKDSWASSSVPFRAYATKAKAAEWKALKAKAESADKAKAEAKS